MANDNFVEIASSETYSKVQKLVENLKEVSSQVKKINTNLNGTKLPSDNKNSLNEINEQQKKLNATRQKSNQLSTEEIINNRTLRQNAEQYAKSVSVLGGAYQRLSSQQAIAAKRVQNLVAEGRKAEQSQRSYNRELKTAQAEFNKLNARVLMADKAVGRFNRNVGNYPKQAARGIRDLLGAFGIVGGVAAIAAITKNIFNTTRELQSMDLALKQVMGSSDAAAQSQAFLSSVSEKYGIEIVGLTQSYTAFYAASKNAIDAGEISAQQIQDIFESVSKASGAMGLSVDQQQGAFLALQQMISKGTVQAEEIRGQLAERLPGAFGILAKSMGVTEQQLNKMLKDGKVLAAEVLPAFAKELEKAYGVENLKRVETLNAETSRLQNTWTEFVKELSSGDGTVTKFFTSIVKGLGGAIDGFRLLIQSRDSLLQDRNTLGSEQGYEDMKKILEEISNVESRRNTALDLQRNLLADNYRLMSQMNKLTQQQKELEAKGLGSDPLSDMFGSDSKYKNNEKQIEQLNYQIGQREGRLKAISKALEELNPKQKESTQLTKEEIEAQKRLREEELRNQYRLNKLRLEANKQSFDDLLDNERSYISERLELSENISEEELKLAKLKLNEDLRISKGNITLQKIAWQEYTDSIYDIQKRSEERTLKLKEDYLDAYYEYRAKFQGEGLKFEVDPLADQWFDKQAEKAQKLTERTKELKNATKEYLDSFSLGFLEESGLGSLTKFFDQTLDPVTGKMQSTFEKLWEGAETTKEKFAVAFTAVTETIQEAMNFANQAQQAYFDAQYSRLEKEHDLAIMYAGDSESAKAEIEKQYEERRREIRRKEAEAQKELAIFNAIINTAQGVVAALANPGGFAGAALAVSVGIIGAAQVALISSQPVPEYRLGTDFHKGGSAIVGDGGKHEVVYQPSSGFSITPKTDTLVDLERGSKVYPDINSFLKNSGAMLGGIPNISLESSGITKSEMEYIMDKYSQNNGSDAVITKTGVEDFIGNSITRQRNLNDRINLKSTRF